MLQYKLACAAQSYGADGFFNLGYEAPTGFVVHITRKDDLAAVIFFVDTRPDNMVGIAVALFGFAFFFGRGKFGRFEVEGYAGDEYVATSYILFSGAERVIDTVMVE